MGYTELRLLEIEKSMTKLLEEQKYLKASLYLQDVVEPTTISNEYMAKYNEGELVTPLFKNGADFDYYARCKGLTKYISRMARHFRDMDDSQTMPVWSNKGYEAAQIVQKYYNSNIINQ